MAIFNRAMGGLLLWAAAGTAGVHAGSFTFEVVGETFTYTDAQRSFSGRILVPPGPGPFAGIVFDHGQGGAPQSYPNTQVFRDWGAVVIAPELTHINGGETAPATTGNMPENLARGIACADALASLSSVDPARIAFFGHSKGAYASIGQVSALGTRILVAGISAGGTVPDSFGTEQAAPTAAEAAGAVAPTIMFHGDLDGAVPAGYSANYQALLQQRNVPTQRVVYDVAALSGSVRHNIHQDPIINADMLFQLHALYEQWGLFDTPLFADGFEPD